MDLARSRRALALVLPWIVPGLAACGSSGGGSDGDSPFTVHDTTTSSAATSEVSFSGDTFGFTASEATTGAGGTDLNGDGDVNDSALILVDVATKAETNLQIAARELAWVGPHLYVVVDESKDERDWDGDGDASADDISLVYWTEGMTEPNFIARLEDEGPAAIVATSERIFFVEEQGAAPGQGFTTLQQIEAAAPELSLPVPTSSDAANGITPRLLGLDEGLLFAYADETVDGEDLNGDADAADALVLLLVDATTASPLVDVTGLGLADEDAPRRARARGEGDWLVGVLVSESAHAGTAPIGGAAFTGFNDPTLFDPTWQPPQCSGITDTDTDDDVLFWIDFADWVVDPVSNPPVNTGLAGVDRVIAVQDYVATISLEVDDGGCDLNEDGDGEDRIVRWVRATTPVLPPVDSAVDLFALAEPADVPGGTAGLAELDGRIVILVDEAADQTDIDLSTDDHRLLGWRDPEDSTTWTFNHGTTIEGSFVDFFGGATWLAETPERNRLLAAVPENVQGDNLNVFTNHDEDTDTNDSVPTFLDFNSTPRLVFPFVRIAVEPDSAGIVIADGIAFYRVSEASDSHDWNGDGDTADHILMRTGLSTGQTAFMAVASNVARPVIEVDPFDANPEGGAFITSEAAAGEDLNGDGDGGDFVVRWFNF
jgi:hypothetical protein